MRSSWRLLQENPERGVLDRVLFISEYRHTTTQKRGGVQGVFAPKARGTLGEKEGMETDESGDDEERVRRRDETRTRVERERSRREEGGPQASRCQGEERRASVSLCEAYVNV